MPPATPETNSGVDAQPDVGSSPVTSGSTSLLSCQDAPLDPGPSPLRLLSQAQYHNTLRDLFGDAAKLEGLLATGPEPSAFGLQQADVSLVDLERFQKTAESVAALVVADKTRLTALVPCPGPSDLRGCASAFIKSFGARAYRAPSLEAEDVERHLELYDAGKKTSHEHGIELVLRGVLQSPRFLYQVELGTAERAGQNAVRLSDHELAARLSYVFWKTLPDETLRSAANAGLLHTKEQLTAQLERMLGDPRGQPVLREFLSSLVHLEQLGQLAKDPTLYPAFRDLALRSSMAEQARRFFDRVLSRDNGTLHALLTSETVLYDRRLAGYYGQTGGDGWEETEQRDDRTSGLLTLPALLSIEAKPDQSAPILRGKFVREVLLCQQLPAPPANIPKPPEVSAGVSTRERLRQHEADPSCSGCHQLLDPIGLAFENFDAVGRYRADDGGKPVDASGELRGTRDANGTIRGVRALGARLAQSKEVEECMTRQWFRFAIGRFEQKVDACAVQKLNDAFSRAGGSLHALPRALVESDAFLYRRPITTGVSP